MYCENCGNKLNNKDKFCEKCGFKVEKSTLRFKIPEINLSKFHVLQNNSMKLRIAIILISISLIFIFIFSLFDTKEVILNEFIKDPTELTTGFNNYGYIDRNNLIDYDKMLDEYLDKYIDKNLDESDYNEDVEKVKYEVNKLIAVIDFDLYINNEIVDQLDNLKNGDQIKIEIYSSVEENEYFKEKYKKSTLIFTVDDLDELTIIDPFDEEYFSLKFYNSDAGTIVDLDQTLNSKIKELYGLDISYSINEDFNISIIETISETNCRSINDSYYFAKDYGIVLLPLEKSFEVEVLGKLITKDTVIKKESLSDFINIAISLIKENNPNVSEIDFVNAYFTFYSLETYADSLSIICSYTQDDSLIYENVEFSSVSVDENGYILSPDKDYGDDCDIETNTAFDIESIINSVGNIDYVLLSTD